MSWCDVVAISNCYVGLYQAEHPEDAVYYGAGVNPRAGNLGGALASACLQFGATGIPAGATINTAYIRLTGWQNDRTIETCRLRVWAVNSATPALPGNTAAFWAVSKTPVYVDWTPPPQAAWQTIENLDVTTLVQYLVDTYPDQIATMQIVFCIWNVDSDNMASREWCYAGWASSNCVRPPYLHVEWANPSVHVRVTNTVDDYTITGYSVSDHTAGSITADANFTTVGISTGNVLNAFGLIFRGITIPEGATIEASHVQFIQHQNGILSPVHARIYGSTSAAAPTTAAQFWAQPLTVTYVDWYNVPAVDALQWNHSVDVSAIIQELVDEAGGLTDAALQLIFFVNGSVGKQRTFVSRDYGEYYGAWLHISYSAPAPEPELIELPGIRSVRHDIWIDLVDRNGNKRGDGPIVTARSWSSTAVLDGAGTFRFEMPLDDPRVAWIDHKVEAQLFGLVGGTIQQLGAGIIDQGQKQISAAAGMLTVWGDDMLRELATRTVGKLELMDWGSGTPDYIGTLIDGVAQKRTTPFSWQWDIDDYQYLIHSAPFRRVTYTLGAGVNSHAATLIYQYFDGETNDWQTLSNVVDGTVVAGVPLAQSGDLTFDIPSTWDTITHDGATGYPIRITHPSGTSSQFDTVNFSNITIEERVPTTNGLAMIMTFAPSGWTVDDVVGHTTTAPVYLKLAGETVLEALVKLAEATGQHFRAGIGRQIVWLGTDSKDCGIRAMSVPNPQTADAFPEIALIKSLRLAGSSYELYTRVYAFGAGSGDGRLTLEDATDTHTGYTVGYDEAVGYWYVEDDAAVLLKGRIEKVQEWNDVRPATETPADRRAAANTLLRKAVEFLREHSTVQHTYEVELVKCDRVLYPGDTIRVVCDHWTDSYHDVAIDQTLNIIEVRTEYDSTGVRTTGLTLSTTKARIDREQDHVVKLLRQARDSNRTGQLLSADDIRVTGAQPGWIFVVGADGRPRFRPLAAVIGGS